jgi:ADP-ribose pyrophosphatase
LERNQRVETWIRSEQKYSGSIFSLRVGDARLDDGSTVRREIVEHPGGVAIVPVKSNSVVLIKQFRISVGREIIELPAGRLEDKESPVECAARELEEELGLRAGRLIPLTSYYSSVGFTNEKMHIFLALDLQVTERKPEWDERIQAVEISIGDVEDKLLNGEFDDSKTIIGLYGLVFYAREHPEVLNVG